MAPGGHGIAVAVVTHEHRVLVGRRSVTAEEAPGRAEFPGGKIEPQETSAAAAARECLEETGIAIRVLDRRIEAGPAAGQVAAITFHWATPVEAAPTPRPPFTWVPIADLARFDFPPANAHVLAILRREHAAACQGGS